MLKLQFKVGEGVNVGVGCGVDVGDGVKLDVGEGEGETVSFTALIVKLQSKDGVGVKLGVAVGVGDGGVYSPQITSQSALAFIKFNLNCTLPTLSYLYLFSSFNSPLVNSK